MVEAKNFERYKVCVETACYLGHCGDEIDDEIRLHVSHGDIVDVCGFALSGFVEELAHHVEDPDQLVAPHDVPQLGFIVQVRPQN